MKRLISLKPANTKIAPRNRTKLEGFFNQLYLAAQPFEHNGSYEEINGGVHVLSSCFK